jgi:MFS transporter, DHA1 family, inner membrane transport protein
VPTLRRAAAHPAVVLFVALFTAQAGFLVLGPVMTRVADDFDVSTAAVGQVRTMSGVAGALAAVALIGLRPRIGPRRMLALGAGLLGVASLASAAAPSLGALMAAQAFAGIAMTLLLSAGVAAVAFWVEPERRARVLAWAMVGQPASWVAGMPVIGAVGAIDWRLAFLAVPVVASLVALVTLSVRPPDPPVPAGERPSLTPLRRDADVRSWAIGELLAYAGWSGVLVYSGALLVERYDAGPGTVGVLLGATALAYFPATFIAGRLVDLHARALLFSLGFGLAGLSVVFGLPLPGLVAVTAVYVVLVFLAGGRTISGSALGLQVGAAQPMTITSVRTAAAQLGNLLGAGLGGLALTLGGYTLLGVVLAVMFALGALPHRAARPRLRAQAALRTPTTRWTESPAGASS